LRTCARSIDTAARRDNGFQIVEKAHKLSRRAIFELVDRDHQALFVEARVDAAYGAPTRIC
jgi:hypothetical protein